MIDFEKLGAKAMIEAIDNFDVFMKSKAYDMELDKVFLEEKGDLNQRKLELLTQEHFLEIFAVTLLKNYHEALTLIIATQGIDLNAL